MSQRIYLVRDLAVLITHTAEFLLHIQVHNTYSQTPIAPMFIKHIQTNIIKQCTEYIWLNTLYVILNVENFSGAISSNKNRITSIKTWHQQIKWRYNPTLVILWQKCIHYLEETSNNISNLVKPFGTKQLTRCWSQRPNDFSAFYSFRPRQLLLFNRSVKVLLSIFIFGLSFFIVIIATFNISVPLDTFK